MMSATTEASGVARGSASEPHPRRWVALGVIAIAQLMVVLDATIVNIALPRAKEALSISTADQQWVVTAYTLAFGGLDSAANPLGVPLSGPIAKAVTRGYHLLSMPGNRVRVAADWLLDLVLPRQGVQLGLVPANAVPLDSADPEGPATGLSAR